VGGFQFSPVVDAFLRGQQQQTEIVQNARDYQLRKKQIEAAIKEAQDRHEQDQERLALDHQIFELNFKKAQQESHDKIIEQLQTNPSLAPGTTNFQQPDVRMAIPGMPGQDQMVPRTSMGMPSSDTVTPQPGTPITVDTAFGPQTLNMPKSNIQQAVEQAKATMPLAIEQYNKTTGASKEAALENAIKLKDIQADYTKQINELKVQEAYYAADSRQATELEKERRQLEMTMFSLFGPEGTAAVANKDPNLFGNIVGRHAARIGQGMEDYSDVPSGLKGAIDTYMGKAGIIKPAKGIRDDISTITGGGQQLLNDFDQLNNAYGAGKQLASRTGNMIADLPFINHFTDLGQRFKLNESNIANYAGLTGETPGMMRSPLLATKAAGATPAPGDTPEVRDRKRNKVIDLVLTKIQRKIGNLSTPQRIEFWRDAIKDMQSIRTDARYSDVLSKILQTGTYQSAYLNEKDNQ
jgi:hypothetical protein